MDKSKKETKLSAVSSNIKFACGYLLLVSWMQLQHWNYHHQIVSDIFQGANL
jgi:hypothetical protein